MVYEEVERRHQRHRSRRKTSVLTTLSLIHICIMKNCQNVRSLRSQRWPGWLRFVRKSSNECLYSNKMKIPHDSSRQRNRSVGAIKQFPSTFGPSHDGTPTSLTQTLADGHSTLERPERCSDCYLWPRAARKRYMGFPIGWPRRALQAVFFSSFGRRGRRKIRTLLSESFDIRSNRSWLVAEVSLSSSAARSELERCGSVALCRVVSQSGELGLLGDVVRYGRETLFS